MPKVNKTISLDIELLEILKKNVGNVSEWVAGQIRSEFGNFDKKSDNGSKAIEPTLEPDDDVKPAEEFYE